MIEKLRQNGYSYKEIADALKISINTVKSFCRRNDLSGTSTNKTYICINCGKELNANKRFCSSTCRQAWWNKNLDKVNRKAYYSFTCSYCHKPFNAYGNKNRKYCSHECYIKDRFGNE